jgi:hypothetical protein
MPKSPAHRKGKTATMAKVAPAKSVPVNEKAPGTTAPKAAPNMKSQAKSGAMTYAGGCHCGKVRYEISSDVAKVVSCNCSICMKSGSLLTFLPAAEFKLKSGAGDLIDYQFNKHVIHHMVCPDCGIKSFARAAAPDGTPTVAVNVRCLDGIDLKALDIVEFDGRSR